MISITEVSSVSRYHTSVIVANTRERNRAFSIAEVLVATGILVPLMTILLVSVFAFYSTSLDQTLKAFKASALEQALNKMVSTCQESSISGISHSSHTLAIQKIEGLRDDGKLYWEKELWLYWLEGQTLYQRRLDEGLLQQNGVTISEFQPLQLSATQLSQLQSRISGRILSDSVSSFDIISSGQWLTLKGRYRHNEGKESHPYVEIVELGL